MAIDKRQLLLRGLTTTGGLRLLESASAWSGLVVLNYHRIGSGENSLFDRALWSAAQHDFERQVEVLKRNCEVIGLEELPDVVLRLESGQTRDRFAMITFDDGYRDNYELAFPVLRSAGVPGVFFITTGFLDDGRLGWWDELSWMVRSSSCTEIDASDWCGERVKIDRPDCDLAIQKLVRVIYGLDADRTDKFLNFLAETTGSGRAPKRLSHDLWMTWENVREMRNSGMSIGAHTVTHPVLATRTAEQQSFEICESKLRIEQELGEPVTALSIPVGRRDSFNDATRTALTHHGIEWAFSYYGGFLSRTKTRQQPVDRLDIPRVAVESDTLLADFRSYVALPQIFARH